MADPGVVVQPGMGIFKIGDYQRVRLRANVAQQDANRIRVGTPILAKVPGADTGVIRGKITSIFPQTETATRTVTVEAVVANPNQQLLSGQFVDMEIITQRRENALSVPQKALVQFNGEPAVWVVNGETAQRRRVTIGLTSRDRIEITDGLEPNARVITSGHSRLMENGKVTLVDALGNPAESTTSPESGPETGKFEVVLASPATLKSGSKAEFTIALKDAETGEPMTIAANDLAVDLTMPMKNMAPMTAKVDLVPGSSPGEFKISTFLGMKGDWTLEATVTDAKQSGKARLSLPVN